MPGEPGNRNLQEEAPCFKARETLATRIFCAVPARSRCYVVYVARPGAMWGGSWIPTPRRGVKRAPVKAGSFASAAVFPDLPTILGEMFERRFLVLGRGR